jgi:Fic family protein
MDSIIKLITEYQSFKLNDIIDYEKFNEYAIVHHSTVIEGSTLTENETRLLLEEGITPKGKPLEHSLMVKDHYEALRFVLHQAETPQPLTLSFIQQINARVMKHTRPVYNTALGQVDASKGEFRKGNVSAGGSYFVNYDKVVSYTSELVNSLTERIKTISSDKEKLELSFDAHFNLVSIYPFYDGNGRTSRLLMNYLQAVCKLPLGIVYKEDKSDYFTALQESRKQESLQPFTAFMFEQYKRYLQHEIDTYKEGFQKQTNPKKGGGRSLFF